MGDRSPCWISVAQTSILIKKSRFGLFGSTLYRCGIVEGAEIGCALWKRHYDDLTPKEMRHPILKAFVNAVLHCSSVREVQQTLAEQKPETDLLQLGDFLASGAWTPTKRNT